MLNKELAKAKYEHEDNVIYIDVGLEYSWLNFNDRG